MISGRIILLLGTAIPALLGAQERADIAIVGGRVMDPASGLDAVRTVAIRADRIVAVTDAEVEAARVIDASGLVVAPGFIDLLARIPPQHEAHRYKSKDGVTTVVSMHG
jgi:predicted amidohydrolase